MYYDYFGLKQPPFKITPDTRLFFPGGNRGAILEALVYAILNGEGIIKVVGEVGSGKTMLCRMLEKELPKTVETVYLANPSLSPENTLHAIALDLKLPVHSDTPRLEVMNKLQEYLVRNHSAGKQIVVFIEEAQGMPIATLEEVRLLSNLETRQNKLLQIVLFGQPELDELISQPEIRQLKERITYSFQLNPFKNNDIKDYLNTRLRVCGFRAGEVFSDKAVRDIDYYSKGLVRRINILADKAMLAAYASNQHTVTAEHVKQAAQDSEFSKHRKKIPWFAVTVSALTVIVFSYAFFLLSGNDETGNSKIGLPEAVVQDNNAAISIKQDHRLEITAEPQEPQTGVLKDTAGHSDEVLAAATNEQIIIDNSINYKNISEATVAEADRDNDGNELADAALPALPGERPVEHPAVQVETSLEQQLIGLEDMFGVERMGETQLSDQELIILQKQLKMLPPEVAFQHDPSSNGNTCKLCWSIIYRPLINPENL